MTNKPIISWTELTRRDTGQIIDWLKAQGFYVNCQEQNDTWAVSVQKRGEAWGAYPYYHFQVTAHDNLMRVAVIKAAMVAWTAIYAGVYLGKDRESGEGTTVDS